MVIVRLGDLDDQRPLGPPYGGKGHQHLLPADGELHRAGLPGGHPLHRVPVAAAELNQRASAQGQGLVRVAGDGALPVYHIGHAALPQVDAADNVVERVVFIYAHHIKGRLARLLHRHSHCNAQPALVDGGGINGQIIRLLKQRQKTAVQALRGGVKPLHQPPIQAVQGDCIKLIDLRRLFQHRTAALRRVHPGVARNGHHAVRQHVYVGLHRLGRLPGHRLKAVQQDIVGKRLHGKGHKGTAYGHQNQDIQGCISQYPSIQAPFYPPAGEGIRLLSRHVPVAPFSMIFVNRQKKKPLALLFPGSAPRGTV